MSVTYRDLSADDIEDMLGELLERLDRRGVGAEIYVIEGAAIALHLGREQLTPDVDAFFSPHDEVSAEAQIMALEYGLDPHWLNERARSYLEFDPTDDAEAVETTIRGRTVRLASKRVLLAVKIAAYRPKDYADITALVADLGIYDAGSITDLVFSVFSEGSIAVQEGREDVLLGAEAAVRRAIKARA